jgi:hypothetical protein
MTKKIAFSVILIILCASFAAAQEEKPTAFLDGAVTFKLPDDWGSIRYVNSPARSHASLNIPYPQAEKLRQAALVTLTASLVSDKVTVKEQSDGVYKNKYEELAVLSDTFDGESWRTIVWTMKAGVPFLMLDRFGVVGGKSVELQAALPLIESGDPRWLERAVSDFNAACESLKVDGQNMFEKKVELEKVMEQLKVKRQ